MKHTHYPIRLRTDGADIVVEMDFGVPNKDGDSYVEIIRERVGFNEVAISHEVLPAGIERAANEHYNGETTNDH